MAVISTEDNSLYIRKGDTGQVEFTDLPTDKTYTAYLSIYNEETNKVIAETTGNTVQSDGTVTIYISNEFSDTLPVGEWVYALKICATVDILGTQEDTVIPRSYINDDGVLVAEQAPAFIVDYKMVEGAS